ncbi:MAG: hypothetical protein JSS98_07170 [Bacteroidetes bacterium]|nr:hypothetical protein [Bacteroidota bacterium]
MKNIITSICSIFILIALTSCQKNTDSILPPAGTDSFMVSVNGGYGSGKYKSGDTVHIFSNALSSNQIFNTWTGDATLLQSPDEWHTWFIMPNKNVTISGSVTNITPVTLQYQQIMGRDRLKPVYYNFPSGHKGIVYLLHGTGGNAANIAASFEWMQLIKILTYNKYAVIITEAEESTTGVDANADGSIRWALLPYDTTANVDYANIRIITNYFYNKGMANPNVPKYSIGMSDGGFFSAALSSIYNFKAGVQYCSQGSSIILQTTTIPTQFCMAANDANPSIGASGNAEALADSKALIARGVCSKYLINQRSPLYSERFALTGDINSTLSNAIFNELKSNGYIDTKNYFIGYSNRLVSDVQNNPTHFPVIGSLTLIQTQAMLEQVNIAVADHHIYSDYNMATLKFLNTQCN